MKLLKETDPILKTKTLVFDFENPPVDPVALSTELHVFMKLNPAVGLSAPQVGLLYRVFVMDAGNNPITCFNPRIISLSEELEWNLEGCLSFPDLWLKVGRPARVVVEFENEFGVLVNGIFENLAATVYQHETNHLDGVLFTTLVGPVSLTKAKAERAKRRKVNK